MPTNVGTKSAAQYCLFDQLPLITTRLVCETRLPFSERIQVSSPADVAGVLQEYFRDLALGVKCAPRFTPGEPLHVAVEHEAGHLPFYAEHGVRDLPVRIDDHNVDRERKGISMCREEAGLQAAPSHERLELYVHHVPVGGYSRKVQWGLEAVFEDDFHYLPERLRRKTEGLAHGCNAHRLKCDLPK